MCDELSVASMLVVVLDEKIPIEAGSNPGSRKVSFVLNGGIQILASPEESLFTALEFVGNSESKVTLWR